MDLNDIPEGAVDHVEVLRDGASAQYGSDAIAGVVNIVLRGNAQGGDITANYGQYAEGDGQKIDVNGWYNFRLGHKGFINIDLELQGGNYSYRDYTDVRQWYFGINNTTGLACGPINTQGQPTTAQPNCHLDSREASVNRRQDGYSDPLTRNARGSLNSEYRLNDNLTFYAFTTVADRLSITQGWTLHTDPLPAEWSRPSSRNLMSTYSMGNVVFLEPP